jgi:hypothetical protein
MKSKSAIIVSVLSVVNAYPQNLCQTKGYCGLVIGKQCYDNYQCVSEVCVETERPVLLMSSHAGYKSCVVKTDMPPEIVTDIKTRYPVEDVIEFALAAAAEVFAAGGGTAAGAHAASEA